VSHMNDTPHLKCHACGALLKDYTTGKCGHCGRLNDLDLRHLQVPVAAGRESQEVACPRCRESLVTIKFKLVELFEIERCKRCLGTFFDVAELEAVLRLAAGNESVDEARLKRLTAEQREVWPISYIPCPVCSELMQRTRFGQSPVIIDRCKKHGAWLDGGELGRLLLWAKLGGLGEIERSVWEEG
jgi:Zn-finger nucleic acid-binding protein